MKKTGTIPMNIQLFADDDANGNNGTDDNANANDGGNTDKGNPTDEKPKAEKPKDQSKAGEKPKEPTVQELMNELAKVKRTQEKAASEAAEWKKKYRATLSEKEQFDAEKAEKEAEREERYKAIERENTIYKIKAAYIEMGYTPDEADRVAVAEADGDFEARTKIMSEVDARKKKELEAEFYASRPDVNVGVGGEVLTKEKFDSMTLVEKSKLYETDPDAYKRFSGQ